MAKPSVQFNFPATKVIFINAVTPDTEYNPEGTYQVTLVYPLKQAESIKAQLEKLHPDFVGKINFREGPDDTGQFKVAQKKFIRWMKAGEQQEQEFKPMLLNRDNTPYDDKANGEPWGGTIAEVAATIETQAGARGKGVIVAMRFRGMRIHELVKGNQGGAAGLFGAPLEMPEDEEPTNDNLPWEENTNTGEEEEETDDCPI